MRPTYTARLTKKVLLSDRAQCYHLEFAIDELDQFLFEPGQFVSCTAEYAGKQQTRAYSLASAADGNSFALLVNRVAEGFFSNLLCDLQVGETIACDGPLGTFTLHAPRTDSMLIATGTGVAPMRGFAQWLFPEAGPDRSEGRQIWLFYGTRYASDVYYREYFEQLAARHANFHYLATLSRPEPGWAGPRGYVQEHVARLLAQGEAVVEGDERSFSRHAYICGLNEMVAAMREQLKGLGWHRRQIVFERYD